MQDKDMIPATEFCVHHKIELSFIQSLHEFGLIDVTYVDEQIFLPSVQLNEVERYVRWHYELEINLEGIDTIVHLLRRTEQLQRQIKQLSSRLKRYEDQ